MGGLPGGLFTQLLCVSFRLYARLRAPQRRHLHQRSIFSSPSDLLPLVFFYIAFRAHSKVVLFLNLKFQSSQNLILDGHFLHAREISIAMFSTSFSVKSLVIRDGKSTTSYQKIQLKVASAVFFLRKV